MKYYTRLNYINMHGLSKVLAIVLLLVLSGAGFIAYKFLKTGDSIETVKIVAVIPNYTVTEVAVEKCHEVTTSKLVKNKDATFFNNLFDSKKYPKYVSKHSKHQECATDYQESQTLTGYVVRYQFGKYVESMAVITPPPLNAEMPFTALQKYQINDLKVNTSTAIKANASFVK